MKEITTVCTVEVTVHQKVNDEQGYAPAPRAEVQERFRSLLDADHVNLLQAQVFEYDIAE